jgi:hypothetical protein
MRAKLVSREPHSIAANWRLALSLNQDSRRTSFGNDVDTTLMSVIAGSSIPQGLKVVTYCIYNIILCEHGWSPDDATNARAHLQATQIKAAA